MPTMPVYGYHPPREIAFKPTRVPGVLYLGAEVETSAPDVTTWNTEQLYLELKRTSFFDMFIATRDSSIGNGAEFVSQPATLQYWLGIEENVRTWFTSLINTGLRGHETESCGLHIHVSRDYFGEIGSVMAKERILALQFLVEANWEAMTQFARRTSHYGYRQWEGGKMNLKQVLSYFRSDPENFSSCSESRRAAVNLQNAKTIEFRFFKGTLNPVTFFATLEFVSNMCKMAKLLSPEEAMLKSISDIIEYQDYGHLKAYARRMHLDINYECAWSAETDPDKEE